MTVDNTVGRSFLESVADLRYPPQGLAAEDLQEIRRIKARMEAERIGRGIDPHQHVKLGPGGLSDVEWTVQLIQLRQAHRLPALRVTGTLAALDAMAEAHLVEPGDAQTLRTAFLLASRIRDANTLLRGRASDVLPTNATDLAQLALAMGYPRAGGSHLDEAWRRASRRAKAVVDRLFWDSPV